MSCVCAGVYLQLQKDLKYLIFLHVCLLKRISAHLFRQEEVKIQKQIFSICMPIQKISVYLLWTAASLRGIKQIS